MDAPRLPAGIGGLVVIGRISLLVASFVLAGCGQGNGAQTPGKLAARVNGTDIIASQVPAADAGGFVQALDKAIDRELLVQQALGAKLDQDPAVARAIEEARRRVLADAWLERTGQKARSTMLEVRAFYAENPALFAQRRVYRLRELAVAGEAGQSAAQIMEQVRAEAANATSLEDVAGWLRWRNLKVGPVTAATQPAEELPLGYLPQLARMREGEIAVFPSALGVSVVQLVQAQDAPLAEEAAAPVIRKFLDGRKKLEVAAAEVKRLRAAAQIEYVGDFKR
jgi:EpsD family peptidyl-prolyl cis-trans isomerase